METPSSPAQQLSQKHALKGQADAQTELHFAAQPIPSTSPTIPGLVRGVVCMIIVVSEPAGVAGAAVTP